MKTLIISAALAAGLLASASSMAATGPELYKSKGCVACHVLSGTKTIGPAYSDVAAKKQDAAVLEKAIKEGSPAGKISGKYPGVVMAMQPRGGNKDLTDAEVKILATWIHGGAKP